MALQIKRGTDLQRQAIVLAEGEPYYVTDHSSLGISPFYIGDGTTPGGVAVAQGSTIFELLDVQVTDPQEGDFFVWNATDGLWENSTNIDVKGTLSAGNIDIRGPITTTDSIIELNKDKTSGESGYFKFNRPGVLSPVSIRYNGTDGKWEFTNNGTVYHRLIDQDWATTSDVKVNSLDSTTFLKAGTFATVGTDLTVGTNLSVGNNATINGNTTIGNATNDTLTINATVGSIKLANNANITGQVATTDAWRIQGNGTADAGSLEIATLGDGNEPIYLRQFLNTTQTNQITALDASGYTILNRLGIGGVTPSSQKLAIYDAYTSNLSLSTTDGTLIVTNNAADDLLSFNFYNANRLQFSGDTGKQWFNSGQTGFNTTNPTSTVDVNGTTKSTIVSSNTFKDYGGTTALTLSGADATIAGDLTVTGNEIKGLGGTTAISLSGSNVTIAGDLTVTGNEIKGSAGTTAVTISGADVAVAGDLTVTGNDIKGSAGLISITLNGADATIAGDLTVTGNDIKGSAGTTAVTISGADVAVAGDLTINGNDIKGLGGTTAISLSGSNVTIAGDLAVNGGDITTTETNIANLYNNSSINTVNIGNSVVTEVNIGGTATGRVQIKPNTIVGASTTQNVFNTVATTVNAFGAADTIRIGKPGSTYTFPGTFNGLASNSLYTANATITNDLTVNNFLTVKGGIKGITAAGETQGTIQLLGGLNYGVSTTVVNGGTSVSPANINSAADNATFITLNPSGSGSLSNSYYELSDLKPGQIVILQNMSYLTYAQVKFNSTRSITVQPAGSAVQIIGSPNGPSYHVVTYLANNVNPLG